MVVQRFPFGYIVHVGMVPGILVFKDLGKVWIFMIFVLVTIPP